MLTFSAPWQYEKFVAYANKTFRQGVFVFKKNFLNKSILQ